MSKNFSGIDIKLERPICNCTKREDGEPPLGWQLNQYAKDGKILTTMKIICRTCGSYIDVQHKELHANFILKREYPDYVPPPEPKEPEMGKIIQFPLNRTRRTA